MPLRNDHSRYGAVAQGLHWTIAALVAALFGIGWFMVGLPPLPDTIRVFNLHKSIGVAVLALMLLRLVWRLISPPPPLPTTMSYPERLAAKLGHLALYLLLFTQALVGLLHSGAANFPVVVFGLFTLPALTGPDDALRQQLGSLHGWLAWVVVAVITLHVLAALRHHLVLKDDVLRRMLPGRTLRSSHRVSGSSRGFLPFVPMAIVLLAPLGAEAAAADASLWQVEETSRVGFVARQAGAEIEGRFERFDAQIRFDPDNLVGSRVTVEIDVASVNTQSSDRDEMIRSADFFNVANWSSARFEATRFVPNGPGHYQAHAQLTLRDVTQDVVLPFDLTIAEHPDDPRSLLATAVGELPILRLDYGVGQGQWHDISTIANEVVIQIEILAARPKD